MFKNNLYDGVAFTNNSHDSSLSFNQSNDIDGVNRELWSSCSSGYHSLGAFSQSHNSRSQLQSSSASEGSASNSDELAGGPTRIQITNDRFGNSLSDAFNLGIVGDSTYTMNDRVSRIDSNDFFRFSLSATNTVTLSLTELSADADLELLDADGALITTSRASGTLSESITRSLLAGTYVVRVFSYNNSDTAYSLGLQATAPSADPGSTLSTAHDFGTLNWGFRNWSESISPSDADDYYRFNMVSAGNFNLSLSNLRADADVQLLDSAGTILAISQFNGSTSESIVRLLTAGTYFIRVYSYGSNNDTGYRLSINAGGAGDGTTDIVTGTLSADRFTLRSTATRTVISGYGNVEFGNGSRDVLDLSSIAFTGVTFNFANSTSGGVAYNPGIGSRIFDAINFSDGRQILFEGIDTIRFADRTIDLSVLANDPLFGQQWNLFMMGVHNAWRFTTGSTSILVGVQDTGLATDSNGAIHEDLRSTGIYSDNYRDELPDADDSHGTAVQSIIAAATNNGIGMSGINWNSSVFNTDVLSGDRNDQSLMQATQNMINEANRAGQQLVINMSLSYLNTFGDTEVLPEFNQIVANNPNVLFVIAAGNNGDREGLSYPATLASLYANVIAVGASWGTRGADGGDRIPGARIQYDQWWASQYGRGLTLMGPSEVVAAKGNESTVNSYFTGPGSRFNGTSAAAPNVTGVASLVWSANRNLTAAQIKQILAQTAVDLSSSGYDYSTGSGFVNADAAVRRAMSLSRGIA